MQVFGGRPGSGNQGLWLRLELQVIVQNFPLDSCICWGPTRVSFLLCILDYSRFNYTTSYETVSTTKPIV